MWSPDATRGIIWRTEVFGVRVHPRQASEPPEGGRIGPGSADTSFRGPGSVTSVWPSKHSSALTCRCISLRVPATISQLVGVNAGDLMECT
jgi:hypothetical protein